MSLESLEVTVMGRGMGQEVEEEDGAICTVSGMHGDVWKQDEL